MKFIERKKLFIRFLKENNIYSSYTNNLKIITVDDIVKKAMKVASSSEIFSSFPWRSTKEGFDFWDNLSTEWMKLIIYNYEHNKKKKTTHQISKRK